MALLVAVGLSWSGWLEQHAGDRLTGTLERALVTAAIARGLNGVISVAQGTEIAVQPIGVGLTISAGQILDPLNDLVERFSWLALVASASLGTQLLLTEIATEPLLSLILTAIAGLTLALLWWPSEIPGRSMLLRGAALFVFVRFLFTVVALTVGWVDSWVLEARQETAMQELTSARDDIEALQTEVETIEPGEPSLLDQLDAMLDEGRQLLDLESQLESLASRAEAAINHLLELIVLFVVQTLLVPIAAFWLTLAAFRWFWGWLRA